MTIYKELQNIHRVLSTKRVELRLLTLSKHSSFIAGL